MPATAIAENTSTETVTKVRVTIESDEGYPNPADEDSQWRIVTFCERHRGHVGKSEYVPDEADPENADPADLLIFKVKLAVGLIYPLRYSEHGLCRWDMGADLDDCDGLLIWQHPIDDMGAQTPQERRADAETFLEYYTCWCNGDMWGYVITPIVEEDGEEYELDELGNCWGFYGCDSEYMLNEIKGVIERRNYPGQVTVEYDGDGAWLAD
jgi:hypothetical protein